MVTFVYLNGVLTGVSVLLWHIMTVYHMSYLAIGAFMFAKNTAFMFGLDYIADCRNKRSCPTHITEKSRFDIPSFYYLGTASVVETVSLVSIATICEVNTRDNFLGTFLTFIPISFAVEIVFDFFHYWAHRFMHTVSALYSFHKTHHSIHGLSGIVTFYQTPIDYGLTNYIPFTASLLLVKYVFQVEYTLLMYCLIVMYKEFIEIAGHVHIIESNTVSFPQCIWLPLFFGIELKQKIHNDHHLYLTCNYAKRFSLWDKVFGTYRP